MTAGSTTREYPNQQPMVNRWTSHRKPPTLLTFHTSGTTNRARPMTTKRNATDSSNAQSSRKLLSRPFLLLLVLVACFGFCWSFFLILPKFFATELNMSAKQIGAVSALPGVAIVLATPLIGKLVDKYGRRVWVTVGTLGMAACGFGFSFVDEVGPLLYAMQLLQGIAFVSAFNAAGTLTADLAPPDRTAQAIGLFGAANLSMNAISPTIGETLADSHSWRVVFLLSAAAGLCAAFVSLWLRDPPREPIASNEQPIASNEQPMSLLTAPLIRVYVATFLFTASFAALFTLHQPFALDYGVNEVRNFFIGFTIVAVSIRLGGGSMIDRMGPFRASVGAMSLYMLTPLVLYGLGPTRLGMVGAFMGLAHGVLYPAITALAIQRADEHSRGMVFSIVHGSFNGGHAAFSFALGAAATAFGYGWSFGLASAITALGVLILIVRPKPV